MQRDPAAPLPRRRFVLTRPGLKPEFLVLTSVRLKPHASTLSQHSRLNPVDPHASAAKKFRASAVGSAQNKLEAPSGGGTLIGYPSRSRAGVARAGEAL